MGNRLHVVCVHAAEMTHTVKLTLKKSGGSKHGKSTSAVHSLKARGSSVPRSTTVMVRYRLVSETENLPRPPISN